MSEALSQEIRRLATGRCEYCRLPESRSLLPHVLDHIIARQHGGLSHLENLALCCGSCNRYKGPNIAGLDPLTKKLTPLFNPRTDAWHDHFEHDHGVILGTTAVGRTTVLVLGLNLLPRVATRRVLGFLD
jgi:hypothetical protein